MREQYNFGDVKVTLSKDKNYARIDDGNFVPIKHNGKHPYVVRVTEKSNGCIKKAERLVLSE